jgi:hypothetical protein
MSLYQNRLYLAMYVGFWLRFILSAKHKIIYLKNPKTSFFGNLSHSTSRTINVIWFLIALCINSFNYIAQFKSILVKSDNKSGTPWTEVCLTLLSLLHPINQLESCSYCMNSPRSSMEEQAWLVGWANNTLAFLPPSPSTHCPRKLGICISLIVDRGLKSICMLWEFRATEFN